MPGRYVFPGGVVEESDGRDRAEGLRICALRELFEEAGVILAREPSKAADLEGKAVGEVRHKLHQGEFGLTDAFRGLGLSPDPRALIPFARWITPRARAKRFDGTFFLALHPQGQEAGADGLETFRGLWLGPARALEENRAGRVLLAPPQVRIVGELAGFGTLEELLERTGETEPEPVRPLLYAQGGERTILLPWDPDYRAGRPLHRAEPCGAGECSRLVHLEGRWLPYLCPDPS